MQIGDKRHSAGESWLETRGNLPSRHLNAHKKGVTDCDYNVCVVYWGNVFMKGLDLSIEDEEARK